MHPALLYGKAERVVFCLMWNRPTACTLCYLQSAEATLSSAKQGTESALEPHSREAVAQVQVSWGVVLTQVGLWQLKDSRPCRSQPCTVAALLQPPHFSQQEVSLDLTSVARSNPCRDGAVAPSTTNLCSSAVHCLRGRPHLCGPGWHQGRVCKDGALSQTIAHAHQHQQSQYCPQWSAAT